MKHFFAWSLGFCLSVTATAFVVAVTDVGGDAMLPVTLQGTPVCALVVYSLWPKSR